ncbi:MAG: hypothetical protein ABUK01_00690 [Leptospirales bacterium]
MTNFQVNSTDDNMKNPNKSDEVGLCMDDWPNFRKAFEGIFSRQYYTDNGPLVVQLESTLKARLNYSNVICVGSSWVSWLMLFDAEPTVNHILVKGKYSENSSAHLAANYVGKNIKFVDETNPSEKPSAFFVKESYHDIFENDYSEGSNKATAIVVEFPEIDCLSGEWGACICTNNDDIADNVRTMRSSSGVIRKMSVKRTVNGRMSEAQAAVVLMNVAPER